MGVKNYLFSRTDIFFLLLSVNIRGDIEINKISTIIQNKNEPNPAGPFTTKEYNQTGWPSGA